MQSACTRDEQHIDACVGAVLGAFIGDALGAPVDLLSAAEIRADPLFGAGVNRMCSQLELSSWRLQAEALGMSLEELAASNPTRPKGHYTDDTLMLLSLCEALLAAGGAVDAEACAASLVEAWRANEASALRGLRGFGSGTAKALRALSDGTATAQSSGRLEHEEGSNRNGGAMRIAPVGLLFARGLAAEQANVGQLRRAVEAAILATHVHPEAVDGAVAVAYVVASNAGRAACPAQEMLRRLAEQVCGTDALRRRFALLCSQWLPSGSVGAEFAWDDAEHRFDLHALRHAGVGFPGVGFTAVDGAAVAAWMALGHGGDPATALVRTIALGGDTDTLACMVGAMVGAAHGWKGGGTFPAEWVDDLENGERGRDFAIRAATALGELPLSATCDA